MTYKVELKPQALKYLKNLPAPDKDKIIERLKLISENPRCEGVVKLSGKDPSQYRIRHGDYRIVYSIHDHVLVVEVIEINHRKDVYK